MNVNSLPDPHSDKNLGSHTVQDFISKPSKPDSLPDKFWDAQKSEVRLASLIKSYCALEKLFAQKTSSDPLEGHEPVQVNRDNLLQELGRPLRPEDYDVKLDHNYFQNDPELNARLHQLGFTQEQVQAVYDLAAEKLVPMVLGMVSDLQAERELHRLVDYFGGPDQWQKIARQLLAFGRKNLPESLLTHLSSHFEGIMMMYQWMIGQQKEGGIMGLGRGRDDQGADQIYALMRDPRYWRDHDPKVVAKVSEGFARLYGD